jgi:hypothetical protein
MRLGHDILMNTEPILAKMTKLSVLAFQKKFFRYFNHFIDSLVKIIATRITFSHNTPFELQ